MKIVELKLENYKSFASLEMREPDLKDFLVFAGRNGTGKTALFEAIAYCLKTPASSSQNGTLSSNFSYVGNTSDTGSAYIKVRLDTDEVAFIDEKFRELKNSGQIYNPESEPPKYSEIVTAEFESKVLFHRNSVGVQPNNIVSLLGSYKATTSDGNGLIHPLAILVDRQICQPLVFFNAYRQVDLSETQIFSQMPQAPMTNQQNFAIQQANMGGGSQSEHRQTMAYPLLRALNEITMYEALEEFNQPAYQEKLVEKLKPQLDILNRLLSPKEILAPKFVKDQNRIEYSVKTSSSEHSISAMSAGENELLILSTYLFKTTTYRQFNGISPITLIDEPELHLHAVYVERLARFIKELDFTKSNCFVASHSPDFIDVFDDALRKIEDGHVKTIIGLERRKELFADIGRKITPSALVENIVFVEGDVSAGKKLHDEYIYQQLLDPEAVRTLFVSVGDRIQARLAGHVSDKFTEAIRASSSDNKLFMLTDGDDGVYNYSESSADSKIRRLNVYHVENLLLGLDGLVNATTLYGSQKTQAEIETILKAILNELVEPTLESIRGVMRRKEQLEILDQLKEPVLEIVQQKRAELENFETDMDTKLATYRTQLEASIETSEWRRLFKGAEVLKKFNKKLNEMSRKSISYLELQNRLLEEMTFSSLLAETQKVLNDFRLDA